MTKRRWPRGRLNAFAEQHKRRWEGGMALLAIVYVAIGFVDDQNIANTQLPTYWYLPFLLVFLLEFAARFYDSKRRVDYLRGHWIDLVTSIPMVGGLRVLRLLRLVKIGAQFRITLFRRNERDTWFIWPTIVLFWVGSAYALWLFEHDVNPHVSSFGDALYLSFMTASTVGYGDVSPISLEGKVTAGLIVFFALGLLGFASSRLTTWWLGMRDDQTNAVLLALLGRLEKQLEANEIVLLQVRALLDTKADPNAVVATAN